MAGQGTARGRIEVTIPVFIVKIHRPRKWSLFPPYVLVQLKDGSRRKLFEGDTLNVNADVRFV